MITLSVSHRVPGGLMTRRVTIAGLALLVSSLFLLAGAGLAPAGAPAPAQAAPAAGPGNPPAHARDMVRAAEEVLRLLQEQEDVGGRALTLEFITLKLEWSRRAVLAVRETQPAAKNELVAARAHRDRVKKTLEVLEKRYHADNNSRIHVQSAKYFLAEAELWLARATEKADSEAR